MSVQLKATAAMSKTKNNNNNNLAKSELVTKDEKEAKDKIGSLKLKISFMRRKEF